MSFLEFNQIETEYLIKHNLIKSPCESDMCECCGFMKELVETEGYEPTQDDYDFFECDNCELLDLIADDQLEYINHH